MDRLDRKIIALLQQDASLTNQALADQVGLSPSACLHRVRRLEQSGVIEGYHASIHLKSICRSVSVIATVSLQDQSTEAFRLFRKEAESIPEVVESFTVSGSFDLFLRVIAPDMDRYNRINDQLLDLIPGKVRINSHVVLENGKPFTGFPLDRLYESD
jgi:Lrp/AsnC family leucine-responsive transcriptional regulator